MGENCKPFMNKCYISIYPTIHKDTCYHSSSDHYFWRSILWRFNNFWVHGCSMIIRSLSFWYIIFILFTFHTWSLSKFSWTHKIVVHVTKSNRLTESCFYHYWIYDAQIYMSLNVKKTWLNRWCMVYALTDIQKFMSYVSYVFEDVLVCARLSCFFFVLGPFVSK